MSNAAGTFEVETTASGLSRRIAIKAGLASLGVAAVGGRLNSAHAQEATPAASPGTCPAISLDDGKALVQRYWDEVWNDSKGDVRAALHDVFAADEVHHWGVGGDTTGPDEFLDRISGFRSAFPDFKIHVEDVVAEGDKVVSRYRATGTHEGDWLGIAPTGTQVEYTGMNIFRIACGKIAESWGEADHLNLLRQLGGLPEVESSTATPAP